MNTHNPKLKYKNVYQFPQDTHDFIKSKIVGKSLHVCCGNSSLGDYHIDIEKQPDQDKDSFILADMFHLPIKPQLFDTVICDPIWNLGYHVRHKLIWQLRDCVKYPNGILIFNSLWFPKINTMKLQDLYVGLNNMAFRNVSLIGIYKKIQEQF